MSHSELDRRDFLKKTLLAGASAGALAAGGSPASAQDTDAGGAKLAETVPRTELGNTGVKIPILVVGCAMKFNPRYDKILHHAYKEGVNYLDTALVYANGQSHATIAPFVKQIADRNKLWITSKGPHHKNKATPETFERDLNTCLKQLEIDYLDMFFMHGINNPKYLTKEYVDMGERFRKQKKSKFFGFSCHGGNVVDLMNKAAALGGIDCIMFRYNFSQYGDRALNLAIDACKKAKIGLIAMKTQKSVPKAQEEVRAFESKNFNLAQAKLKAVWADERIDSVVSHMDNMQKLKENVAAAKSPIKIGMHEFQQLNRLAACTAAYSCQGCSHLCEPKVEGETRVADALRFLMYHESYGEQDKARQLWKELAPAERRVDDVDFAAASAACPEGIDISGRLRRAQELLG